MTNIVNVITTKNDTGVRTVVFEFPYCDTDESLENDELEMQCLQNVRELTDDNVKHWLCDHKWKEESA
jgi:hypothetical protein